MDLGFTLPARRDVAIDRALAWRLALGALVCASIVARTWVAWLRATPNYFPDEYIYASLSRSIAAGHLPSVRGHVAHFPALLQPILTAPAWWFGSLETGYRITQLILAVSVSTAGLAVWWTARRLGVGRGTAFAAAAISLAVPDAGYAGWVLSGPVAYPLFIAAVGTGAVALSRPAPRTHATFLGLALLATFARLQLAVLFIAYLAAAIALRRLREQRVVAGGIALVAVIALAGGLGYYRKAPTSFHLDGPGALGRNALVLAFAAGWIVVPAGLLGVLGAWRRPHSEEQRAFGVLALAVGVGVLAEASFYGVASVVHERYGFYVLPLLALGFALHAERRWPWPRAHAALAAVMLLASALVPMSAWAAAGGNSHSFVLTGLLELEKVAGSPGDGALLAAAAAAVLSVGAVACAWRRATAVAAALAVALCLAACGFAATFNVQNLRNVHAAFLPAGPEWVHGRATLVAGPASSRTSVLEQLFWNRGLALDVVPGAPSPDVFAASHLPLAKVRGPVLLDETDSAIVPLEPVTRNGPWLEARTAQVGAIVGGLASDGWFAPAGSGWAAPKGHVSFTVTAPQAMTLTIGGRRLRLRAHVATPVCVTGAFAYRFSRHGYLGLRAVSARATFPRFTRNAGCS